MKYGKLPFKKYTVISNCLIQSLGCSDVYRAYVLLLTTDKHTLETDTTIEQLAGFVGESKYNYGTGKHSSHSFNDKLKSTGEVNIYKTTSKRTDRRRNIYQFKQVQPGNYRRVSRIFYDTYKDIDLKLKGFILKLFSIAAPHSYVIRLPVTKFATIIHMTPKTINEYIKRLKKTELVEAEKDILMLKAEGLLLDMPKDTFVEETIAKYNQQIEIRKRKRIVLTKQQLIYTKAKADNFTNIRNMHSFLSALEMGKIGKAKQHVTEEPRELPVIIL